MEVGVGWRWTWGVGGGGGGEGGNLRGFRPLLTNNGGSFERGGEVLWSLWPLSRLPSQLIPLKEVPSEFAVGTIF